MRTKIQVMIVAVGMLAGVATVPAHGQTGDEHSKMGKASSGTMSHEEVMAKIDKMSTDDKAAMIDKMSAKDKKAAMGASGQVMSKMSSQEKADMFDKMSMDQKMTMVNGGSMMHKGGKMKKMGMEKMDK